MVYDGHMRRLLTVILAVLLFPAAAQAKEITGLAVCGPDECNETDAAGLGHDGFASGDAQQAPPPGPFYRLDLLVDGGQRESIFYEPRTGLAAFDGGSGYASWVQLRPAVATRVTELAKTVAPFSTPTVTRVRYADKVVTAGAATYLDLFTLDGSFALPGAGDAYVVHLDGPVPSPWTDARITYYPDDDIVQTAGGRFVRLPAGFAADLEAGRPLAAEPPARVVPWVVIGIAGAFAAVLLLALLLRRRGTAAPAPAPL